MSGKLRILFMGTPDFAVSSLDAMVKNGENVIAAVTQPDKPKNRGHALTPPPVKIYAQEHGIEVFQPETFKEGAFDETLKKLNPDIIAVAAYGKILPHGVIAYPEFGCVNVHGSLLPEYRGAAPIQRAVINGEKITGITIMKMDDGMDTGDILLQRSVEIGENESFGELGERLAVLGAEMLVEVIGGTERGEIVPVRQDEGKATYAAKISKDECRIDYGKTAGEVHNLIRGLSPFPLAYSRLPGGMMLKISESEVAEVTGSAGECGVVKSLDGGIVVCCKTGTVRFLTVIPEGRSKMSAADFVRGRKIREGDRLD